MNMEVLKNDLKTCLHCQAGEVNFVDFSMVKIGQGIKINVSINIKFCIYKNY